VLKKMVDRQQHKKKKRNKIQQQQQDQKRFAKIMQNKISARVN